MWHNEPCHDESPTVHAPRACKSPSASASAAAAAAPTTWRAWRRRAGAVRHARDCRAPISRTALPLRTRRQRGAEAHALAQCRHRVGLQRHAVRAPALGALSGRHQARGARSRRHRAIRRRRAGHVRRRDAGPARHGVVAVQPRRDRDGDRRRAGAQHVRRGAVPRHLRQDRARPADRRAGVRPPAGDLRAGRPHALRRSEQGEGAHPPAVTPRARPAARRCSNRRPAVITRRAPARSTAPPTATRC